MAKKTSKKTTKKATVKKAEKPVKTTEKKPKDTASKKPAKTPVSAKTKKHNEPHIRKHMSSNLTPEQIERYRILLLAKRAELLGDVNSMEGDALRKSENDTGNLSSMPIHMADIGTDNYEQEFALGLLDSERKILREIDAALDRIKEGTFGLCEGTGNPISIARLEANPWARYCIEYARMVEQGMVREGDKVESYSENDDESEDDDELYEENEDEEEDEDESDDDEEKSSFNPYFEEDQEDDGRMLYE